MSLIPCQCCGREFPPTNWSWYVCDKCGYRICLHCLTKHKGRYSYGGSKCSQCMHGFLRLKQ